MATKKSPIDWSQEVSKAQATALKKMVTASATKVLERAASDIGERIARKWLKDNMPQLESDLIKALDEAWPKIVKRTADRWAKRGELELY